MSTVVSTTELLRMTPDELRRDIALHKVEYAKMRMGVEMQKEKNHASFKAKRRDIARMMTALTQMKKHPKSVDKPSPAAKKPVKVSGSRSKKTV